MLSRVTLSGTNVIETWQPLPPFNIDLYEIINHYRATFSAGKPDFQERTIK